MDARFERAIAAIDSANSADPVQLTVGDRTGPKELLHGELLTHWVGALEPGASEALLLAARGHDIERWRWPRTESPEGRGGYLHTDSGTEFDEATGTLTRLAGKLIGAGGGSSSVGGEVGAGGISVKPLSNSHNSNPLHSPARGHA